MKHFLCKLILLSGIVLIPASHAQQRSMPADADITREITRIEPERRALFDAKNPDIVRPANSFPNIPTLATNGVDIAAIARRYEQTPQAVKRDEAMVFASFTMPPAALQRLVASAAKIGAAVVFRGFKNNSLKDTSTAIRELGQRNGALLVNPTAFTKYKVTSVPMLVLVRPDGAEQLDSEGCALPDTFVSVSGDVSLDYALETIEQRSPEFAPTATRILRQFRGRE